MVFGLLTGLVRTTLRLAIIAVSFFVILGYGSANYLDLHLDSENSRAEYVTSAVEVALITMGIGILTVVAGVGIGRFLRDVLALVRKEPPHTKSGGC